jgi:hypothetical protein
MSAIDRDGDDLRHSPHADRQHAAPLRGGLVVALRGPFLRPFSGQALDVAGTDLHTGQVQGARSIRGGRQPRRRLRKLRPQRRTVALVVEAQRTP